MICLLCWLLFLILSCSEFFQVYLNLSTRNIIRTVVYIISSFKGSEVVDLFLSTRNIIWTVVYIISSFKDSEVVDLFLSTCNIIWAVVNIISSFKGNEVVDFFLLLQMLQFKFVHSQESLLSGNTFLERFSQRYEEIVKLLSLNTLSITPLKEFKEFQCICLGFFSGYPESN